MRKKLTKPAVVPSWAHDAIWYQIFPERFRNGLRKNDPRLADIARHRVPGWRVCPWGMDWYRREPWEKPLGDFFHSVYLRRFGGDIAGIREKLDYLQDLGVNALYLNPVFQAPSLHKYDASCLHHVDPTLGPDRAGDLRALAGARETEDPATWIWTSADRALVDLVADVHARGMRIILDGVFNHAGRDFFAFRDLLKKGRASRYRRWFKIKEWNDDGSFEYDGWFGFKGLPEFARTSGNLAPPVARYVFDITRRWMDPDGDGNPADGIDGWRLDVAFCVPHGFWKRWRRLVKSINPDAYLAAEIVTRADDYLRGDEFDAVMNYMWLFPTYDFFAPVDRPIAASAFRRRLDALRRAYPPEVTPVLQNLLDSHDVGRIATMLANAREPIRDFQHYFQVSRTHDHPDLDTRRPGRSVFDVLRQMVIFQMTCVGAPMIYYGTEVGMWGANDPDDRQPMLWDDVRHEPETHTAAGRCGARSRRPDARLQAFYKQAIALRARHKVFRRGALTWVDTGDERLLGFLRENAVARVLVLLNARDRGAAYALKTGAVDLWESGRRVPRGVLWIAPRGWKILALRSGGI
jgi:cyclomaltodextrinase / maltogenic alpha-amylase / neopullulanase